MKKIVARHGASAVLPYFVSELKHRSKTFEWVLGHIEELGPDARESLPVLRSLAETVKPRRMVRMDDVIEKVEGKLEIRNSNS